MRQITAENTEFIAIAITTLKAGVLSSAVFLLSYCDVSPTTARQACRDQIRTLDVARAKSRFNQLKVGSLQKIVDDGRGRVAATTDAALLARAAEELRIAQDDVEARLRNCDGLASQ